LQEFAPVHGVTVLAYCLMPNHVHLVAVPRRENSFARLFQRVHSDYARAIHLRLHRTGHLWQARYHSVPLDEYHLKVATAYLQHNPVRAALVSDPKDWRWSGARCWHDDTAAVITSDQIDRVRQATVTGQPFGSPEFLNGIRTFSPHVTVRKRGRPRKEP
jgi:putative transposase